ncbi:hypothetical protein JT317_gp47 [Klebsiella phage YMC16/01/N133_KPN_BP]|uniref:Uncharacterized protein n=1 Tax=Klebsiella phage YMC16/01/N133_KPN_BP TaxID=2026102 RepID=A0A248XD93_9CAUD|nr:hypothetical protein JT317_gp47 [Klebsiella phage YMC16/01/N133_KPN_BP]ASW27666.1 hypothetical protein KPNN133_047 [Klebsiella phage YMC16/01/N133_KPN_BP]
MEREELITEFVHLVQRHSMVTSVQNTVNLLRFNVGAYQSTQMSDEQLAQANDVLNKDYAKLQSEQAVLMARRRQQRDIEIHNRAVDARKAAKRKAKLERRRGAIGR